MRTNELQRLERQLPAAAAQIARDVRTGASLSEAIGRSASSADGLLAQDLSRVTSAVSRGVSLHTALEGWRRARGSSAVDLFVAACRFSHRHGGHTAPALEGVATALSDRLEVADECHALTAQARLSAVVLAALPIVGAIGFSVLDPQVGRLLLTTPAGWACLVIGGCLDLAGLLIVRRMVGSVVR